MFMFNTQNFLNIMSEILEEDIVDLDFQLNEDNWSSISVVSCLAEFDDQFNILVNGDALAKCENVQDVFNLLESTNA